MMAKPEKPGAAEPDASPEDERIVDRIWDQIGRRDEKSPGNGKRPPRSPAHPA